MNLNIICVYHIKTKSTPSKKKNSTCRLVLKSSRHELSSRHCFTYQTYEQYIINSLWVAAMTLKIMYMYLFD